MINKIILLIASLLLSITSLTVAATNVKKTEQGAGYIHYEGINNVAISRKEINRIVSKEKILDIKHPKNDRIITKIEGKNAYIQYKSKTPTLIYITTAKHVYTVRLQPSSLGAQILKLGYEQDPKLVPLFGNEREKVVVNLLRAAFVDDRILDEATVTNLNKTVKVVKDIDIREHRRYDFASDDIYLKVFIVKLGSFFKGDRFRISEKNFLIPQLCQNPLGIAIEKDYLTKNDYTRLFIVGRKK